MLIKDHYLSAMVQEKWHILWINMILQENLSHMFFTNPLDHQILSHLVHLK